MSLFVLDTDIVSLLQRGHPRVVSRCAARRPEELAISVISLEEQLSGWYSLLRKTKQPDELLTLPTAKARGFSVRRRLPDCEVLHRLPDVPLAKTFGRAPPYPTEPWAPHDEPGCPSAQLGSRKGYPSIWSMFYGGTFPHNGLHRVVKEPTPMYQGSALKSTQGPPSSHP